MGDCLFGVFGSSPDGCAGAGVGVVIVVLEGICNGIYRMYRPAMEKMNLEEEKKDYHLAECEWDEKTPDAPWKNKEECERRIHYFKGVKDKEELEKRLSGLLRIYRPEKEFAEDALTRSILVNLIFKRQTSGESKGCMMKNAKTARRNPVREVDKTLKSDIIKE